LTPITAGKLEWRPKSKEFRNSRLSVAGVSGRPNPAELEGILDLGFRAQSAIPPQKEFRQRCQRHGFPSKPLQEVKGALR